MYIQLLNDKIICEEKSIKTRMLLLTIIIFPLIAYLIYFITIINIEDIQTIDRIVFFIELGLTLVMGIAFSMFGLFYLVIHKEKKYTFNLNNLEITEKKSNNQIIDIHSDSISRIEKIEYRKRNKILPNLVIYTIFHNQEKLNFKIKNELEKLEILDNHIEKYFQIPINKIEKGFR
ncbi:MAG: hypothetical protein OEY49_03750 [Candidatus Heimdallarchaeota archaeon]|nr:hypothetical protein [Candidatus Heimdallarchaeota archaeon]